MNDLIIGCSTNYTWDTIKYWVNSINQSGYKGDKAMILFNCDIDTAQKVVDAGFAVIGFQQDEQGNLVYESDLKIHVERFLHIYDTLSKNDYRYVVTTDVKDVIFQKDPMEFIEKTIGDKNLIFASESINYQDEPWGNQNLLETFGPFIHERFKGNEIFNVGVLAGKGYAIRDLALSIFLSSINRPIPIVDQSTFNVMVSMEPYQSTSLYVSSENGWACQLGTTADPSKLEAFKPFLLEETPKWTDDGIVTTSKDIDYYIVHQYDRVPSLKALIEKKYG